MNMDFMFNTPYRMHYSVYVLSCCLILTSGQLHAVAKSEFIGIDRILSGYHIEAVYPYSIALVSEQKGISPKNLIAIPQLNSTLTYISKIKINKQSYFRLTLGNFKTKKKASVALKYYQKIFSGAWINIRSDQETQLITKTILGSKKNKIKQTPIKKNKVFVKQLLDKIAQYFLDSDYAKVISSANKIIEIGNLKQQQKAMELMGIARERQGKFAQAIAIYNDFLLRFPNSKLSSQINNRLIGLKTMREKPKQRLSKYKPKPKNIHWATFGSFSQYYQNDVLDNDNQGTQTQNSSILTNINVLSRKNDTHTRLEWRFDAGINNNLLDNSSDPRINRAMFSYTHKDKQYKITSGRQSRTAKGIFNRFDGVVFSNTDNNLNYSLYTGLPVLSAKDSFNKNSYFIGGNINFNSFDDATTDIYLIEQRINGLTDRQAIGSETQYISNNGFFYGLIDYDIFYSDLNYLSMISNYRYNKKWSFNITLDYRNSPFLTTQNALQGQSVATINELKNSYNPQEIYSLAQDRTSKSSNLYFSSSYQIDPDHQLYMSASLNSTQATKSSATVLATPSSKSLYLSADYTIKNYFNINDYTSIGGRLSQSDTSNIVSIQTRTQFYGAHKIRYQPRFNIDYRLNKNTDLTQWILKPSLKMNYTLNKKISFEGEFSFEFSDFNLPDNDKETTYRLFLGYLYQF